MLTVIFVSNDFLTYWKSKQLYQEKKKNKILMLWFFKNKAKKSNRTCSGCSDCGKETEENEKEKW